MGNKVDQALFGYSDGHRQLAASVRLPSRDTYDLAAASDLATGVTMQGADSYLTGLLLRESRHYALVRTWSAPEMPRPGCVWSHVLIISSRLLVSLADLAPLLQLFRKPDNASTQAFESPLHVMESFSQRKPSSSGPIRLIMDSYYHGRNSPLSVNFEEEELEVAIMAIWSQQWPRLRSNFSFRTARSNPHTRVAEKYDLSFTRSEQIPEIAGRGELSWLSAAVADACTGTITPLRRFLWRYGGDLQEPRKRYQTLVKLHQNLASGHIKQFPYDWAISVFETFRDPADAKTLKRDILGVGSPGLAICPAVSTSALIRLLADFDGLTELATDDEIEARLSGSPSEMATVGWVYGSQGKSLANRSAPIERALYASADESIVHNAELPNSVRAKILRVRPDLIAPRALEYFTPAELVTLYSDTDWLDTRSTILRSIAQRPSSDALELFDLYPNEMFDAVLWADENEKLDSSWPQALHARSEEILNCGIVERLVTTSDMARIVRLMEYPIPDHGNEVAKLFANALSHITDDVRSAARLELQAFLFVLAMKSSSPASVTLVAFGISDLLRAASSSLLPDRSIDLLRKNLPDLSWDNWDIRRRLLLAVGNMHRESRLGRHEIQTFGLLRSDQDVVFETRVTKQSERISTWNPFRGW